MRSALEHGHKHFGYAARGATVHSRDQEARHWARVSRLSGSDAKARTLSPGTMSAGRNPLVANRSRCQDERRPDLARFSPEHTWSLFAGAEWAAGVVFRAVGSPHPPMMIRR